MRKLCRGPPT